jgi:ABC-type Na+ transport system ATPase subunit NatA
VLGIDPRTDPVKLKRRVGYVAERQDFYPWMRVGELLDFVAHYRPEWDAPYAEHLRRELGLDLEPRVSELSKGQRAMVALALALASSFKNVPLDQKTVIFGEVGLAGEIRTVPHIEQRLREAEKLGFTRCLLPASLHKRLPPTTTIQAIGITSLAEAIEVAFEA